MKLLMSITEIKSKINSITSTSSQRHGLLSSPESRASDKAQAAWRDALYFAEYAKSDLIIEDQYQRNDWGLSDGFYEPMCDDLVEVANKQIKAAQSTK